VDARKTPINPGLHGVSRSKTPPCEVQIAENGLRITTKKARPHHLDCPKRWTQEPILD
jgi:hypothetical protein